MRQSRPLLLRVALGAMLLTMIVAVPVAHAYDGEVIQLGSNVAGEVYLSNGRPRFNFGNVGNCPGAPPPGSSCWVEVQFVWRCTEPWCLFDETSGWYRVPAGQDFFQAPICADGGNRWTVNTRIHWVLADVHQVEAWAQLEWNAALGANFWIPKTLFDVTANTGLRLTGGAGTKINVITASNAVSSYGKVASSFGALQGPASC